VPNRRHGHLESAILRQLEAAETVTRQSANTVSVSASVAELERSTTPRSTTTTSSGWRRTSRHAPVQPRRRRSTRPLGVVAEEQTPTALRSPRKLNPRLAAPASTYREVRRTSSSPDTYLQRAPPGTMPLHRAPVSTYGQAHAVVQLVYASENSSDRYTE